ncbi:MAG: carboxypeptidase-like regulatory domain-containing protein, partial [Butyricimonas faecihominis]
VNLNQATLDELVRVIFGESFGYRLVDNLIVITPKTVVAKEEKKTILMKGQVVDKGGVPLPGVTVLIKGTSVGVVTDTAGMYKVTLPDQKDITLLFSFIGMISKEVKVGNQKEINVVLEEDVEKLDEVVVTGYSNIKKSSFTGNATAVTRDELMKTNNKNIISAIQAFDPSFRIRENSLWGSDPNALPEFNIRGESSIGMKKGLDIEQMRQEQHTDLKDNPNLPIFIMDGFEVDVQKVYDMDMNRVESLTILKDAAATAMYGSRAANGVVVITTIAPKPGQLMVSYNGTFSLELPDLSDYNVCNATEKLELERLCGVYESENKDIAVVNELAYNALLQQVLRGYNTDWMAQPLRNAFNHKHSIYVEGGVESIRYGVDLKYETNGGVMKGSYRDRMGAGLTLDYRYKKLQIRNYVSYNSTRSENSPYGNFSEYVDMMPYWRIY